MSLDDIPTQTYRGALVKVGTCSQINTILSDADLKLQGAREAVAHSDEAKHVFRNDPEQRYINRGRFNGVWFVQPTRKHRPAGWLDS